MITWQRPASVIFVAALMALTGLPVVAGIDGNGSFFVAVPRFGEA